MLNKTFFSKLVKLKYRYFDKESSSAMSKQYVETLTSCTLFSDILYVMKGFSFARSL